MAKYVVSVTTTKKKAVVRVNKKTTLRAIILNELDFVKDKQDVMLKFSNEEEISAFTTILGGNTRSLMVRSKKEAQQEVDEVVKILSERLKVTIVEGGI